MAQNYPYSLLEIKEFAADMMIYIERHKLIEVFTRVIAEMVLFKPEEPEKWLGENIKRIAETIYTNCIEISEGLPGCDEKPECKFCILPSGFLYRIAFWGRPGSGRKSHARNIAKYYNVIYIDADILMYQTLREKTQLSLDLKKAFANNNRFAIGEVLTRIVDRRLLQEDCLKHGWVLVNYPCNPCTLRYFLQARIPPNKFIYLQCDEVKAMRSLIGRPTLGSPQDKLTYWNKEMDFFNKVEKEMEEILAHRQEAVFVDANRCFEPVRTEIFARLIESPYIIGHRV